MDLTHSVTQSWPRERSFLPEKKMTSINPSVVINTGDSFLVTTSHMSHNYRVMLYVSILKRGKTSFWQWVCLPYNCIYIYIYILVCNFSIYFLGGKTILYHFVLQEGMYLSVCRETQLVVRTRTLKIIC